MASTFGQSLKEIRRAKGISQRELAKKVGVDFSYISKIENDRLAPPAADTIVKICKALAISPDDLLAVTGKMPTPVKEMLSTSPAALEFMREAQTMKLSDEEWQDMTQRLKRLRGN